MPWTWVLGGGALLVVHSLMEEEEIIRSQQQRSSNEKEIRTAAEQIRIDLRGRSIRHVP
jgi:hypothetical protein